MKHRADRRKHPFRQYFFFNLSLALFPVLCFTGSATAQPGAAGFQADVATYRHYLTGQWDSLLITGNKALNDGVDFYYLRLRMAYASYSLADYRTAVWHYERAARFQPPDSITREYLYYSCLLANLLPEKQKAAFGLSPYARKINGIRSPDYLSQSTSQLTVLFSGSEEKALNVNISGKPDIYGEVTLYGNSLFLQQGFRHEPAARLSVFQQYGFLSLEMAKRIRYFHMPDSGHADTTGRFTINQHQYYINPSFYAGRGWSVSPSFHLIVLEGNSFTWHYAWDSIHYWANPGWDTIQSIRYLYSYTFPQQSLAQHNKVFGLHISKNHKKWQFGLSGSYSDLLSEQQAQLTGQVTWFPSGNPRTYLSIWSSRFIREVDPGKALDFSASESRWIAGGYAGRQFSRNTWLEAHFTLGDQSLTNEYNGTIVYNSPEPTRFKTGLSTYFLLSEKMQLSLHYRFIARRGTFWYYSNEGRIKDETYHYSTHSITGGIQWKI